LALFESSGVQTKLRVSQPGDADEREADRAAEQVVSSRHAPVLQRKCACGGSCSKCQDEQETVLHRSAVGPLRSFPFSIQRTADDSAHTPAAQTPKGASKHPGEHPHPVVVEDNAPSLAPGQMRKTQFVELLQTSTCATADAILESVGHTTKSCPYIKKWLAHYKKTDAHHLTRALHKYAPETVRARSAHEAIALVNHRVQRATLSWAKTGKTKDLPPEIQEAIAGGGGFLGAVAGFAASGFGSALLGFLGGSKKASASEAGSVQKKSRDGSATRTHDASTVKEQLGTGHALDGRVQGQMSSAFGYDFSGVRVHTDGHAGELSSQLNARAFTIGSDVAFASGEYQPGTLVGDALIAHELAHVVQQGGGKQSGGPQTKDASLSDDRSLELDADRSAVGAVVSALTGAKKGLKDIGANALPRLKSGLKLQRCGRHDPVPGRTPEIPITQEELGKHAVSCMISANRGPHTKTSGVWYAEGYKENFPDAWDDDYLKGYADPEYWEWIGQWQWRLKKGRSASAGVKAWLKGLTIAECYATAIVSEVDSIRAGIGDAKFDEQYGSEDKAVEPRLELGGKGSNALGGGRLRYKSMAGGVGTIGHRPATVGEWHYFYNHPKYLLKHPGGVYQGENAMLRQETTPNGDQLWEGLGQRKVTERQMYINMMADYNRARNDWDNKALEDIRKRHGGVLPAQYDAANFPDRLNSYEEILNEPPSNIDGTVRTGGYNPTSGKSLDPAKVQELKDMP